MLYVCIPIDIILKYIKHLLYKGYIFFIYSNCHSLNHTLHAILVNCFGKINLQLKILKSNSKYWQELVE